MDDLAVLRQRVAELEAREAEHRRMEEMLKRMELLSKENDGVKKAFEEQRVHYDDEREQRRHREGTAFTAERKSQAGLRHDPGRRVDQRARP